MPSVTNALANAVTTATAPTTTSSDQTQNQGQNFMQLLLAQMTQQDPLQPMSNQDLMSQIIGIETLDRLDSLNTSVQGLATSNTVTAGDLLGKTVEVADGNSTVKGTVESIRLGGSTPQVVVDGTAYGLNSVTSVEQ